MKLHLIIAGLGGGQPVIQITGSQGGIFTFIWDRPRCAHVLSYDFDKPGEEKKFRREQFDLLNQSHQWPITLDVTLEEKSEVGSRKSEVPKAPEESPDLTDLPSFMEARAEELTEGDEPESKTVPAPPKPSRKAKSHHKAKAKG